jgi:gas vesicle protein
MKNTKNAARGWLRLAAKLGLLFTEPKVRAAVNDSISAVRDSIKDRFDDVTDSVSSRYNDVSEGVAGSYKEAVDRLEAAADALQGRNYWISRLTGFALGVGIGAGVGMLFAPAAGRETRDAVRDKATDVKNKIVESAASTTGKIRRSVASMPSTGTEG